MWEIKTGNTTTMLLSVCFSNADNGWISGQNGLILNSNDGGNTWSPQSSGTPYILHSINFINNNIGWFAGNFGTLCRTDDGGNSWQTQVVPSISYHSLFFLDESIGWAVGFDGIILKTTNGGVSFIDSRNEHSESDFSLDQNYPNPFNPSTKIRFEIPDLVRNDNLLVTLKVYDILGKEVVALLNEEKQPGTYEIEFNSKSHSHRSENLSSGVYFYKLTAGSFAQTKKMILIQ